MAVALAQPKPRTRRKLTFEEFLERPEGEFSEWVDGRLLRMSVDTDHEDITSFLVAILRIFVETRRLGRVLAAPALMRLADRPSGREPDVMFVVKANAARIAKKYVDGPADLAHIVLCLEKFHPGWKRRCNKHHVACGPGQSGRSAKHFPKGFS